MSPAAAQDRHRIHCRLDELLADRGMTLTRLSELVGISLVNLSVLKNAGIVADDRRGNQVFYRLRVPCILDFFRCVEAVIQGGAAENVRCSCKC